MFSVSFLNLQLENVTFINKNYEITKFEGSFFPLATDK